MTRKEVMIIAINEMNTSLKLDSVFEDCELINISGPEKDSSGSNSYDLSLNYKGGEYAFFVEITVQGDIRCECWSVPNKE
jgi:hypothetical protein